MEINSIGLMRGSFHLVSIRLNLYPAFSSARRRLIPKWDRRTMGGFIDASGLWECRVCRAYNWLIIVSICESYHTEVRRVR
jgi:hypothetical protein